MQRGPLRVASCRPNITPLQGPAQVCHCRTLGQNVDPQTRLELLGPRVYSALCFAVALQKQGAQGERTQCLPDQIKPNRPQAVVDLGCDRLPDCRLVAETHHIPTSTSIPHRRQPDSLSLFFPPPLPLTTLRRTILSISLPHRSSCFSFADLLSQICVRLSASTVSFFFLLCLPFTRLSVVSFWALLDLGPHRNLTPARRPPPRPLLLSIPCRRDRLNLKLILLCVYSRPGRLPNRQLVLGGKLSADSIRVVVVGVSRHPVNISTNHPSVSPREPNRIPAHLQLTTIIFLLLALLPRARHSGMSLTTPNLMRWPLLTRIYLDSPMASSPKSARPPTPTMASALSSPRLVRDTLSTNIL